MDEGTFPKCLKLGGPIKDPTQFDCRAIAWIEDEVDQWVESRIEERDSIGFCNYYMSYLLSWKDFFLSNQLFRKILQVLKFVN